MSGPASLLQFTGFCALNSPIGGPCLWRWGLGQVFGWKQQERALPSAEEAWLPYCAPPSQHLDVQSWGCWVIFEHSVHVDVRVVGVQGRATEGRVLGTTRPALLMWDAGLPPRMVASKQSGRGVGDGPSMASWLPVHNFRPAAAWVDPSCEIIIGECGGLWPT